MLFQNVKDSPKESPFYPSPSLPVPIYKGTCIILYFVSTEIL
jgi:hypothetical protein